MIPHTHRSTDNRGQVIIITALLVSVLIIGSVIYLNTASMTSRRQADGVPEYSQPASPALLETRYAVSNAIRHINYNNQDYQTQTEKHTALQAAITDLEQTLSNRFHTQISMISLSLATANMDGTLLVQDEYRNLTIPAGTSYDVVTGASGIRAFSFAFSNATLPSQTQPFRVILTSQNGTTYTYEFYSTSPNTLTIENTATGATETFPVNNTYHPVVSFSQATITGDRWTGFPPTNSISSVRFENTDQISTRFSLVVDGGTINENANDNALDQCTQPNPPPGLCGGNANTASGINQYPAIYSANVSVTIRTPPTTIHTTITVKPRLGYIYTE